MMNKKEKIALSAVLGLTREQIDIEFKKYGDIEFVDKFLKELYNYTNNHSFLESYSITKSILLCILSGVNENIRKLLLTGLITTNYDKARKDIDNLSKFTEDKNDGTTKL